MSSLVLESVILIRLATEAVLLESTRSGSATNFTHSLKKRAARNTVTHCSHCALCHSRVSLKTLRTCTQCLLRLDCRTACAQELTINFRFRCVSYQAAKCMKHTGLQKNSIDDSTSRLRSTMSKKFEKDKTEPFPIPTETRAQHKKKTRRTTIWYHCSVYSSTFDVECLLRVLWRMHKRKMESPVQKKKGTRFHNTSPPRARVPTLEVAAPILSWERLGVLHLVE